MQDAPARQGEAEPLMAALGRRMATALSISVTFLAAPAIAQPVETVTERHCLPIDPSEPKSDELEKLQAAAELVGQSDYFDDLMRNSSVTICVGPHMTLFRGHYELDANIVVIAEQASPPEMALTLAHELRHVDQAARGYAPSIDFDMQENARQIFALEADAQAITVLFAWSMREVGDVSLWRTLKALDHVSDMAIAFETAITAGKGERAATSAAFSAWYQSERWLERYFRSVAGAYLDQLDESRFLQSYRELPRDHFDRLCLMPNGERYGCRPPQ